MSGTMIYPPVGNSLKYRGIAFSASLINNGVKKMGLEEHMGIILDALQDYRRWFDDGDDQNSDSFRESDQETTRQIDDAIEYLENI